MFGVAAIALAALSACGQLAIAAMNQSETTDFQVVDDRLYMNGEINSRTLEQFNAIYAAHPEIKTLIQLHVPGSLDDDTMIALGYRVRSLGLNTHLTEASEIYSGGVDLFLAGVERTMVPGAVLGVHSWSDGERDAKDFPLTAPEHDQNRDYIDAMLGSGSFYWFTIYAAPADGMHIMTRDEIRKYGLLTR